MHPSGKCSRAPIWLLTCLALTLAMGCGSGPGPGPAGDGSAPAADGEGPTASSQACSDSCQAQARVPFCAPSGGVEGCVALCESVRAASPGCAEAHDAYQACLAAQDAFQCFNGTVTPDNTRCQTEAVAWSSCTAGGG